MKTIRAIAAALSALTIVGGAHAATFDYQFTSTVTSAMTPGVAVGDLVTLDMYLDNGGNTAASQTWDGTQVIDFTLHAGTYSATYRTVYMPSTFVFQTNGGAGVSNVQFDGTDPTSFNTDSFSSGFYGDYLYSNPVFVDSRGAYNWVADQFTNTSAWAEVAPAAAVPEPTNMALMFAGLCAFVVMRRRRA